jgi:hypothetical protein
LGVAIQYEFSGKMAGNRAMNETNFVENPAIFCDNCFKYGENV